MRQLLILLFVSMFLSCKPKASDLQTTGVIDSSSVFNVATSGAVSQSNPDISIEEVKKLMMGNPDEIVLLDVRTPDEVALGTIGKPLLIDYNNPEFKDKISTLDKSKKYIVYCAVGGRSSSAVSYMRNAGFTQAYNMLGGYNEWSKSEK